MHRDLKASNYVVTTEGDIKLVDFGLARELKKPSTKAKEHKIIHEYTLPVVTLWFRPPEILLGQSDYNETIDMWAAGCLFGELLKNFPLFPGKSEKDQLQRIFSLLGTPNNESCPGISHLPNWNQSKFRTQPYSRLRQSFPELSESGFELLRGLLAYDPKRRITAAVALNHKYFDELPLSARPNMASLRFRPAGNLCTNSPAKVESDNFD